MKAFSTTLVNSVAVIALLATTTACSLVNLNDLGIPNPFGGGNEIPVASDPTSAASTFVGPAPTNVAGGFGTAPTGFTNNSFTGGGFGTGGVPGVAGSVAPGSDARPTDPTAARAYDMIVARAQSTCSVPPLIIGFGRVNGGYNANATCPAGGGNMSGFATPYNAIGLSQ